MSGELAQTARVQGGSTRLPMHKQRAHATVHHVLLNLPVRVMPVPQRQCEYPSERALAMLCDTS